MNAADKAGVHDLRVLLLQPPRRGTLLRPRTRTPLMTCRCDNPGCALPTPPATNSKDLDPVVVPGVIPLNRYELVTDW